MVIEKPADTGDGRAQSLIARIRNGESSLFAELVKPYERRVYVTALALLTLEVYYRNLPVNRPELGEMVKETGKGPSPKK